MKVEKIGNYLIIDGEYYAPKKLVEHTTGQTLEFKKIPKEDFEIIKKLAKKLSKNINAEQIMMDVLAEIPNSTLSRLSKQIKKKKKVIQRHGCIDMKVGNIVLPIR